MHIPSVVFGSGQHQFAMDLYSRLLHDRIIFFNDEVNSFTAGLLVAQMIHLANAGSDPIHFYINSPGGAVIDGLSVIDTMKNLSCDVYTYGLGMQASMGSLLLVNGKKGHRMIYRNSYVMIHSILSGYQGKLPDMEESLKFTQKLKAVITESYLSNTKLSAEELESIYRSPDRWIDSEEALAMGIVDGII